MKKIMSSRNLVELQLCCCVKLGIRDLTLMWLDADPGYQGLSQGKALIRLNPGMTKRGFCE